MTLTTGPRNRRPKGGRTGLGVTLLELILVMAIIVATLGLAAPSLGGFFGSRRTADAAARVLALANYARAQAAAEATPYRLHMDTLRGEYWLERRDGGAFARLETEFGRTFRLPDGTRANWVVRPAASSREYIEFMPDGRTEAARLRLTGRHQETFDVACASPTERFRVVEPSGETL